MRKDRQQAEKTSKVLLAVWIFYLIGAATRGVLAHYFQVGALLFPAGATVTNGRPGNPD